MDYSQLLDFLKSNSVLGNSLDQYALALIVFVGALIVFKILQSLIILRIEAFAASTQTQLDDTLIEIVRSIRPPFYSFLSFYISVQTLTLTPNLNQVITAILIAWIVYQAIYGFQIFIDYIGKTYLAEQDSQQDESAVAALKLVSKIALWSIGILMILSNMGINITSLIAGLGIGGVAVAFAVKDLLGDLLSSFAIYFDKPFKIGDFIVVNDQPGTVKKIGIKTTRIQALQGEELVFPNTILTSSQVQNFKRMHQRRIVFTIGVTYDTPLKKLKKIPEQIEQIVEDQQHADFDRAHFHEFGDSSLNFEIVYHVTTGDYNQYMDTQQNINFSILKIFEKNKIDIAFPTRTIHLQKS